MKRWFLLLFVILAVASNSFSQTPGEFRSDVKGPPYPWTNLNFANDAGVLRFAIVSDRAGWPRKGVLEKAVDRLNALQPEFVICVGDVADNPDDAKSVSEFRREHTILDRIVGKLKMPFFYVAGNHDIYNDLAAKQYRLRHGKPYYSFVYKDVLFLVLCTEDPPPDTISPMQVAYVKKTLRANPKVRWTFVFMHKPFFTEPKGKANPAWTQIETALADRPYTVFAGHWHKYNAYTKNGQKHIVLATTGGDSKLTGPKNGEFDEIAWVTLGEKDKEPAITNMMLDSLLPWDYRKPTPLGNSVPRKTAHHPAAPARHSSNVKADPKPAKKKTSPVK